MKYAAIRGLFCLGMTVLSVGWSCTDSFGAAEDMAEAGNRDAVPVYQVSNRLENDRQILSAANQCFRSGETEGAFVVQGRNYMPEGSILKVFYGDAVEYSSTPEDLQGDWNSVYFSVEWSDSREDSAGDSDQERGSPSLGELDKKYWRIGDTVTGDIAGRQYMFRCIDQNYRNTSGAGQTMALFLCDSVIPADTGASYTHEKQEDGSYDYVYHPGPIAVFGDSSSYKDSQVRQWLESVVAESWELVPTDIGVDFCYTGRTQKGTFSQLDAKDLSPQALGYQKLTGRLFLLSVEEALRYRQYLWRFGIGLQEPENPETEIGAFSKGYWLRTPCGGKEAVYMVDLVDGMIRPQSVSKADFDESIVEGMDVPVMSIGVRPAFALPQQG